MEQLVGAGLAKRIDPGPSIADPAAAQKAMYVVPTTFSTNAASTNYVASQVIQNR